MESLDKEEELSSLGSRIKKIREGKNITQAELAARVNKDQQSIQRLEAGRVNPSHISLKEIAEGLGININEVV